MNGNASECRPQKVAAIFVYGTLKRGQCRESQWPVRPIRIDPTWVLGKLYDRVDYPAMISGHDRVFGELWQFPFETMPVVLRKLDQIEGTNQPGEPNLYVRALVDVHDLSDQPLGQAYTYHYASDPCLDGFTPIEPPHKGQGVAWPMNLSR